MTRQTHFHFIGIGGIGMGAIALLLLKKGHKVSGSDVRENALTKELKQEGANVFLGHSAQNIQGADIVVYSSAVAPDNPEIQEAKKKNITLFKRAQMLANLMGAQKSITVAGAHGKTTTTSMISHVLIDAGKEPTTAVGGIISGKSYNASLGDGTYFVAEVDESDGSFLYFSPYYSVITNIDEEHLDHYKTTENILKAYREFIDKTNFDGLIFICGEDERLKQLLKESNRSFMQYGFSKNNDIYATNATLQEYETRFRCVYKGKDLGEVSLRIPGRHNVLNALACIALALTLGISFDAIAKSLASYVGVQRRFQLKACHNDVMVVDDYGHHPTEIKATLQAAKTFGRRLIIAFQPHRYTRTKLLMDDFVEVLSVCPNLILTDIYPASEKPIEGITSQVLYERIKEKTKGTVVYLKKEEIRAYLKEIIKPGDLVLTLGAGDINRISDDLSVWLKKNKVNAGKL